MNAGDGVDFISLQLPHEGNNQSSCFFLSNQDIEKIKLCYRDYHEFSREKWNLFLFLNRSKRHAVPERLRQNHGQEAHLSFPKHITLYLTSIIFSKADEENSPLFFLQKGILNPYHCSVLVKAHIKNIFSSEIDLLPRNHILQALSRMQEEFPSNYRDRFLLRTCFPSTYCI